MTLTRQRIAFHDASSSTVSHNWACHQYKLLSSVV